MYRSRLSAAIRWLYKNVWAIATLILAWAIAVYVVNHFRKPGQLTPIEAQAMDMSHMEPPAGTTPVATAIATRGPLRQTVTYTGSVVPLNEEVVSPRVSGRIVSLPVYPGDAVRPGQVVARLDAAELGVALSEADAAADMARHARSTATQQAAAAAAKVDVARASRAEAAQAVADAEAGLKSAASRKEAARAERAGAAEVVTAAEAAVRSAEADAAYWRSEIAREKTLLDAGAVSLQEYQMEKAQAAAANSRARQAGAELGKAKAGLRAATAGVQAAAAAASAATAQVARAKAGVRTADAGIQAAKSEAGAAGSEAREKQAAIRQSEAQTRGAAIRQGYTTVTSSLGGRVTARLVAPGSLVSPETPILKVADLSRVRLQANVAASDLDRIAVGAPVTAFPQGNRNKAIQATVTSIFPAADTESRTAVVEAVVPNPDARFQAGSYVVMEIGSGHSRDALSVPSPAVIQLTAGPAVWTMHSSDGKIGTAHRVKVRTGGSSGERTEIISGLSGGQTVITMGQENLTEGAAVQSVPWGPDGPAALPKPGAGQTGRLSASSGWKAVQTADMLQATLEIAPQPPSAEHLNTLTLHLTEHSHPVDGARVTFRTDMPTMSMGGPTVTPKRAGKGAYAASLAMMSGVWRVRADIERGGKVTTLTFEVNIP